MSTCQKTIDIHKRYESLAKKAIELHNLGTPWGKIAKQFNIDRDCFVNFLARNGLYQKKPKRKELYNEKILNTAKELYEKEAISISNIARNLGVNRKKLSRDLKEKFGIEILHDGKKPVNDNYFSEIDTNEKAYWLGFLFADGHNTGYPTCVIDFSLKDEDKQAVEYFREAIGSKHKISRKLSTYPGAGKYFINWRISIKSPKLSMDLDALGCHNNKSYDIRMPNIDEKYIWHFLRGFCDGDGCLYESRGIHLCITSASYKFLLDLTEILDKHKISSHIYKVLGKNNWIIYTHGKSALAFCDKLYEDSTVNTRLSRKYNKYLSFSTCRPKSKTA